jgi:hypothetical protein
MQYQLREAIRALAAWRSRELVFGRCDGIRKLRVRRFRVYHGFLPCWRLFYLYGVAQAS